MWDSKLINTDHISWKIGNDREAKFWVDSWNGEESLTGLLGNPDWITELADKCGHTMDKYVNGEIGGAR